MFMPVGIFGIGLATFAALILTMRAVRRLTGRMTAPPHLPAFNQAEIEAMLVAGKITPEERDRLLGVILKQRDSDDPVVAVPGPRGFEVLPAKGQAEAPKA